jgi:hypothetical protein
MSPEPPETPGGSGACRREPLRSTAGITGSGPPNSVGGRPANIDAASLSDVRPLLTTLSRASAVPVLSALRRIHRSYIEADRLMGSMCLTGPIRLQMPVVERACEVTRGADRAEMLGFACQFMEFGGWLFQDAGDLTCAMIHRRLGRWRQDPAVASLRRSLKVLVDSFMPEREAS